MLSNIVKKCLNLTFYVYIPITIGKYMFLTTSGHLNKNIMNEMDKYNTFVDKWEEKLGNHQELVEEHEKYKKNIKNITSNHLYKSPTKTLQDSLKWPYHASQFIYSKINESNPAID